MGAKLSATKLYGATACLKALNAATSYLDGLL